MEPAFSEAVVSTEALDQLRSQISALSESEKAELAWELLMSLNGPRDEFVEQAWNDEIVRRVSPVRDGKATLLSRYRFRCQLQEKLDRQRCCYSRFLDFLATNNRITQLGSEEVARHG